MCPFSLNLQPYLRGSAPFSPVLVSHWCRYLVLCWKCLLITIEVENSSACFPCLLVAWDRPWELSLSVVPEGTFWENFQGGTSGKDYSPDKKRWASGSCLLLPLDVTVILWSTWTMKLVGFWCPFCHRFFRAWSQMALGW